MAELDESKNRLTIKLVYYGPALSGKTTNLMRLHDMLAPGMKGELMTLETKNDRTLFFDLLPLGFHCPSGLLIKFMLYTVPGQVAHDSTRKAVLSRADGVVFVADSQLSQGINNAESFQNLADNVARIGKNFETLPLVVQFNKRDLKNTYSEQQIKDRWRNRLWPLCFSSALSGTGVRETFIQLLEQVFDGLTDAYALESKHGLNKQKFIESTI